MLFPWIPVLIWLRPRIKLLNLKNKNGKGDPLFGYMMLAALAMAVPDIITQDYLITSTGKLTHLDRISQIDSLPKTKYYSTTHFYADKEFVRFKTRFVVSGKYNSNFDMYIYAVVPVYSENHTVKTYNFKISSPHSTINSDNALIVLNGKPIAKEDLTNINPHSIKKVIVLKGEAATALYGKAAAAGAILIQTNQNKVADTLQVIHDDNQHYPTFVWLGIKYEKTVSNHLSVDEKNVRYKQFAEETQAEFNNRRVDQFQYLDRINYSDDLKGYMAAVNSDKYPVVNGPVTVLAPVNESFEARNGKKFPWIFGSLGIGSAIFLIALLFKPLRSDASSVDMKEQQIKDKKSLLMWLRTCIVPQKSLLITQLLIQINLFIFIIMACAGLGFISFTGPELLKWGANFRPAIHNGEYWRLLTNIFLHGGFIHVLMNMYGLFFVGLFLEPLMGRGKYLLTYLLAGLMASIASIWWHPATISVGASGAIFGLYGAFFAFITVNLFPAASKKTFLINTSIFIGYNLLFGLTGGIDNAAHIGGLLTGLILGYALYPSLKDKVKQAHADAETQQFLDSLNSKSHKQSDE